ncbi:L,D-transpeptidase [Paludibacterium paludis]|nr:L,D-transpeptidase [Paludibacterium paludis]
MKPLFLLLLLVPACRAGDASPPADGTESFAIQAQLAAPLLPTEPNPHAYGAPWIRIGLKSQTLVRFDEWGRETRRYLVSTAKNGPGERVNSYKTPRGWHRVCEKIGDGVEVDRIIFRREVTPWKYTDALHRDYPAKDWILTRILWLCGMEPGRNLGGEVDSHDRNIYIHGAGRHVAFGTPTSLGCVRMRGDDVIELFDATPVGTDVVIDENG